MKVGLLRFGRAHRERVRAAQLRPVVWLGVGWPKYGLTPDQELERQRIKDAFWASLERTHADATLHRTLGPSA